MKTEWIDANEKLPEEGKYVLAIHNRGTWNDSTDQDHVCMVVVKLKKGLSEQQRDDMKNGLLEDPVEYTISNFGRVPCKRSSLYCSEDEHSNNKKPYCWNTFGSDTFHGQAISYWMPLPDPPKQMLKFLRRSIMEKITSQISEKDKLVMAEINKKMFGLTEEQRKAIRKQFIN